jgi:hypothetical protein
VLASLSRAKSTACFSCGNSANSLNVSELHQTLHKVREVIDRVFPQLTQC